MKNNYYLYILLLSFFVIVFVSCDKSLNEQELPPLVPKSIEENGGSWKTIIAPSATAVDIAAPLDESSSAYAAEIQELKNVTANLTSKQRDAVNYWRAGGVVRWNEIIRELISRHNLAPVANADGTYPAPDQTKPNVYPEFPFANPPYTARALALLSVAQYDALVAAWHYKFLYKKSAPYKNDNSVKTILPKSDLPSYPSEDAVIAAASLELMKFLFPAEIPYLMEKAEEQKNARIWAGANVKSEIAAGDSLGRKVAAFIINHAKADGMRTAGLFTPEMKETCEAFARTNFGEKAVWRSLEIPARPGMLPSYGKVKAWLFDEQTKAAIRPPAPPKIGSEQFEKDLQELRNYSKNITREQFRIVSYWADGTGTYSPPGHWNKKAADLIVASQFSELRTARTFALMNMASADAGVCCWETKYHYFYARPCQIDPKIKTLTGLPNFPTYTSGHSTFSGAAATVLGYIFPDKKAELESMALEASVSRIYGGIHFRFDCEEGLKAGNRIGEFAVAKGKADGSSD